MRSSHFCCSVGERFVRGQLREGTVDSFFGRQQRLSFVRGMLDHRDNFHECLVVINLVGTLEILDGEPFGSRRQLVLEFRECRRAPVPWTVEQDTYGVDLVSSSPPRNG